MLAHGQGRRTCLNNGVYAGIYEGRYMDDKRHGHGTYTYANGDVFVGEWTNDMKNGRGRTDDKRVVLSA